MRMSSRTTHSPSRGPAGETSRTAWWQLDEFVRRIGFGLESAAWSHRRTIAENIRSRSTSPSRPSLARDQSTCGWWQTGPDRNSDSRTRFGRDFFFFQLQSCRHSDSSTLQSALTYPILDLVRPSQWLADEQSLAGHGHTLPIGF